MPQAIAIYGATFSTLMWVGLVSGVVMLLLTPLLKKGMHGVL